MSGLVDKYGNSLSSRVLNKKAAPPALGERYGAWAGEEIRMMTLPGGGAMAFNLDNLTLSDYRQMKSHYQINSSLSVLTFMLHQMEWHVECDDPKMKTFLTDSLSRIWSRLVRAKSQALWAGYSPNVLQWENDVDNKSVVLDKIKDLLPEDCFVKWKTIKSGGSATESPQSFKVYDGIKQIGARDVPVANSYWYPLLMRNGNYYGEQLLKSAFQPWFFSMLMHLFANRYYERFGEPVPVGRAPFEETVNIDGKDVPGNQLMGALLQQIRNRSVVVLPNEKTQFGDETTLDYDYQIEYLESQMRGADFERYMTRLDEEISLALFTPILMMRTADVGSYNLGTQHTQVYLWMLNAISGDWADYINKYIVAPLNLYNSPRGVNAPRAEIKFARMGKVQTELLQAVITELLKEGKINFQAKELGEMIGLTVEEVNVVTQPESPSEPAADSSADSTDGNNNKTSNARFASQVYATAEEIKTRLEPQVGKAFRNGTFGVDFEPSLGYQRRFEESLRADGFANPEKKTADFYGNMNNWLKTTTAFGKEEFSDSAQYVRLFDSMIKTEIDKLVSSV